VKGTVISHENEIDLQDRASTNTTEPGSSELEHQKQARSASDAVKPRRRSSLHIWEEQLSSWRCSASFHPTVILADTLHARCHAYHGPRVVLSVSRGLRLVSARIFFTRQCFLGSFVDPPLHTLRAPHKNTQRTACLRLYPPPAPHPNYLFTLTISGSVSFHFSLLWTI
jgi:hypothetical protein